MKDMYNRTMEGSAWCGIPFDKPDGSSQLLLVVSSGIFFVIPMTLILILYLQIALALHRSSTNQSLRRYCPSHHPSPDMAPAHPIPSSTVINNTAGGGGGGGNGAGGGVSGMERETHNNSSQQYSINSVGTPAPAQPILIGKRCQAEMAHIQSRRAVIKMLGK